MLIAQCVSVLIHLYVDLFFLFTILSMLSYFSYNQCPSCMDEELARQAAAFTTSVVLHDDLVPRLSPRSVRSLVADLLKNREVRDSHNLSLYMHVHFHICCH
jgi:hypothetical protein